jgi:copper chaperone
MLYILVFIYNILSPLSHPSLSSPILRLLQILVLHCKNFRRIIMEKIDIEVKGMTCGHCKMAVEKAAASIPGVKKAVVDLGSSKVTIEHEGADINSIKNAINEAGYQAV